MSNLYPLVNQGTTMQLNEVQYVLETMVYYPTRSHNPMPLRPYVFNVESGAMDIISDRMASSGTSVISPNMLNGITSRIVQPSTVGFDSTINTDWVNNRRLLFMFKVRHINHMGAEINTYIFGYTEYDGISASGHIDMGMTHYVNNIIETTVFAVNTPLGINRSEKLNNIYSTIYSTSTKDVYTQRPTDLYSNITANSMAGFLEEGMHVVVGANTVSPFSNNVVTSSAENGITTEYLSKILTSGIQANRSREVHVGSYSIGYDDPASRFFTEPDIADNSFLRTLARHSGSRVTKPTFNFNALMSIDPNAYGNFKKFNMTNDFSSPVLNKTPEVGDYWNGQDPVTIKAFSLIENCVAMATRYGFTKLSFTATNMAGPTTQLLFAILDFNSFLSLDSREFNQLLSIFEEKFKTEIFISETNGGTTPLFMECHINLLGTSKIFLEYSGWPGNWFTVPTFASSLYTPVMTTDAGMIDYSASNINAALNSLAEATQHDYAAKVPYTY